MKAPDDSIVIKDFHGKLQSGSLQLAKGASNSRALYLARITY